MESGAAGSKEVIPDKRLAQSGSFSKQRVPNVRYPSVVHS